MANYPPASTEYDLESEGPLPLTPEDIERNKDFTDLRCELGFVSGNADLYRQHVESLLRKTPHPDVKEWAQGIRFENVPADPQLPVEVARKVLERLPEGLVKVSDLESVDYQLYSKGIPIPNFDALGFIDSTMPCRELVSLEDFYRGVEEGKYHPGRILIGNTLNGKIRPTQIPKTVSTDPQAILYYQIHVLLHEFVHTIEQRFRRGRRAHALKMKFPDKSETTFQDWRKELLHSMTHEEPLFTSRYAESYQNKIRQGMDEDDVALAEQITENFVAYYLGIVPNSHNSLSFSNFNAGNLNPRYQELKGHPNYRHELMEQFASATYCETAE